MGDYVRDFEILGSDDVPTVGGKNASLGEMISGLRDEGIRVPGGFAVTAQAYRDFLKHSNLEEGIADHLKHFDDGSLSLEQAGKKIRRLFHKAEFPGGLAKAISAAYRDLCSRYENDELDVAVRSSATAEDLPEASFAGQQETFLNITGADELLDACRRCYASLFTDRAISYRRERGFDHLKVALSVGVQHMVRSDKGSAGVMFTLDTDSGFPDVVVINASWGLGENVVQGSVTPDEYVVFKPLLNGEHRMPILQKQRGAKEKKMIYSSGGSSPVKNVDTSRQERESFVLDDETILHLARWACAIERHYGTPMDIEWALDGRSGEVFIVQARPETVQSRKKGSSLKTYRIRENGERLLEGLAIGDSVAAGRAQVIQSADDIDRFEDNAVLVTGMTDPDWVPIMKKASAIVTDHGGRTSHAAIVSRELGIPAVVGTDSATRTLRDAGEVTVSCAEGARGYVYRGALDFEEREISLEDIPETDTRIMINLASPEDAFRWWCLPVQGVGLARMEFIINNIIKIHPLALVHFDSLEEDVRSSVEDLTRGYENKTDYFVEHLSRGIAKIAACAFPDPVIVRMSDFKTNEYAGLLGGRTFEPQEDNPMLGFRGASRYCSEAYREGFALECRALKRARDEIGMTNIVAMIPFCRTPGEADRVLEVMRDNGLERSGDFSVYVMCEIPSNVVLAGDFAERFDGFSIGSNDLTQLVLGIDRDSEELSSLFDERNEAVKKMIAAVIDDAHKAGVKVGLCGQAPSDYPEFAEFLVAAGIDSISLNPDSVLQVLQQVAGEENKKR